MKPVGLVAITLLCMLNGCAALNGKPSPADAPGDVASLPPPPVESPPPTKPPPVKPSPAKPPAKPANSAEELVGLDQDSVIKLLGDPADIHDEGSARVLSYRARSCAFDVILFLDVKTGVQRVLSYDVQADNGKAPKANPCYGELRGRR